MSKFIKQCLPSQPYESSQQPGFHCSALRNQCRFIWLLLTRQPGDHMESNVWSPLGPYEPAGDRYKLQVQCSLWLEPQNQSSLWDNHSIDYECCSDTWNITSQHLTPIMTSHHWNQWSCLCTVSFQSWAMLREPHTLRQRYLYPVFIASLFSIVKNLNQHRCSWTENRQ